MEEKKKRGESGITLLVTSTEEVTRILGHLLELNRVYMFEITYLCVCVCVCVCVC